MSRRDRHRRRHHGHRGGAFGRTTFLALAVVLAFAGLGALSVVGYVVSVAASAPSIDSLKPVDQGSTSVVYARNGERLGFIESDELRTPIPSSEIPQTVKDATVAIEDERFFSHQGVDFEGVVRAAVRNIESGKTVEGGSTITMQLVRNLYITQERTFERKIREAKLAEELENDRDKKWILGKYLNTVPYGTIGGRTAIGIQAAARIFFDKPAKKLKVHEAALLAGLPQAPSLWNPFLDPVAARERRNEVLFKMSQLGMIKPQTAETAMQRDLGVKTSSFYTARREGFFFDYVKQELIDRYGAAEVRKGGLRITTTVDLKLQEAARKAMAGRLGQPGDPASAIVSIDPKTGYIKAMASSARYGGSARFNLAAQGRRQPGSTFKIMVLMEAVRRGIDPRSTSYASRPLKLNLPYGQWEVKTYDNTYGGQMDLVRATTASDNSVYAQLILDLGPEKIKKAAQDMGITTKLDGFPAEGLGGLKRGVSPLEMANAYATIASGGYRNKPIAVTKVVRPDGSTDNLGKSKRKKAFETGVTSVVTDILQRNMSEGTGTQAQIGCPAAGKTGTTDDYNDAWFVGYTPRLSTSVWVGHPNAQIEMRNVHGISVAGGTFPAQIWGDYMRVAMNGRCADFQNRGARPSFSPFYGRYATQGPGRAAQPAPAGQGQPGVSTGGGAPSRGGGGRGGYDPNLYESPPQPAPRVQSAPAPPPEPPARAGGTGDASPSSD